MKHKKEMKRSRDYLQKNQELRAEIEHTRNCIDSARNHFEQAVEPTLIDCYIYELNTPTAISVSSPAIQKPGVIFGCQTCNFCSPYPAFAGFGARNSDLMSEA